MAALCSKKEYDLWMAYWKADLQWALLCCTAAAQQWAQLSAPDGTQYIVVESQKIACCAVQSEREELDKMGYMWADLQWALSVLHSRCFTVGFTAGSPAVHLTAPGIDMVNHTFTPNASVR